MRQSVPVSRFIKDLTKVPWRDFLHVSVFLRPSPSPHKIFFSQRRVGTKYLTRDGTNVLNLVMTFITSFYKS